MAQGSFEIMPAEECSTVEIAPCFQRVFIVDEDPMQRTALGSYFLNRGVHEVVQSSNGALACGRLVDADSHDLVVLDLNTAEQDSSELLAHLEDTGYQGALLVIGGPQSKMYQSLDHFAETHDLNFLGAITKPVNYMDLNELTRPN